VSIYYIDIDVDGCVGIVISSMGFQGLHKPKIRTTFAMCIGNYIPFNGAKSLPFNLNHKHSKVHILDFARKALG